MEAASHSSLIVRNLSGKNDNDASDDAIEQTDFRNTQFILQNLKITNEDCYDDRFGGFESRKQLCKSVSLQVCFYVACALRSFIDKTRAPVLLVLGAGHSGSIVVEMLVKCGCAQFLRIHCRGDYSAKHWTAKKLQSDTSLEGLLQGQKADIVVLCSPLSSFSTIGRILRRYVAPNTFLISTTFGLTRRRICSVLHISSVFRTYQEPVSLLKRVNDAYKSNPLSKKRRSKSERTPGEQHSDVSSDSSGDDSFGEVDKKAVMPVPDASCLNEEQQAADLIAQRCWDVRYLVFVLENYYALRDMGHEVARQEAVHAIFGRHEDLLLGTANTTAAASASPKHPTSSVSTSNNKGAAGKHAQGQGEVEDEAKVIDVVSQHANIDDADHGDGTMSPTKFAENMTTEDISTMVGALVSAYNHSVGAEGSAEEGTVAASTEAAAAKQIQDPLSTNHMSRQKKNTSTGTGTGAAITDSTESAAAAAAAAAAAVTTLTATATDTTIRAANKMARALTNTSATSLLTASSATNTLEDATTANRMGSTIGQLMTSASESFSGDEQGNPPAAGGEGLPHQVENGGELGAAGAEGHPHHLLHKKDSFRTRQDAAKKKMNAALDPVRQRLQHRVARHFQRQFSKYIKVVDLPRFGDEPAALFPHLNPSSSASTCTRSSMGDAGSLDDSLKSGRGRRKSNYEPTNDGDGDIPAPLFDVAADVMIPKAHAEGDDVELTGKTQLEKEVNNLDGPVKLAQNKDIQIVSSPRSLLKNMFKLKVSGGPTTEADTNISTEKPAAENIGIILSNIDAAAEVEHDGIILEAPQPPDHVLEEHQQAEQEQPPLLPTVSAVPVPPAALKESYSLRLKNYLRRQEGKLAEEPIGEPMYDSYLILKIVSEDERCKTGSKALLRLLAEIDADSDEDITMEEKKSVGDLFDGIIDEVYDWASAAADEGEIEGEASEEAKVGNVSAPSPHRSPAASPSRGRDRGRAKRVESDMYFPRDSPHASPSRGRGATVLASEGLGLVLQAETVKITREKEKRRAAAELLATKSQFTRSMRDARYQQASRVAISPGPASPGTTSPASSVGGYNMDRYQRLFAELPGSISSIAGGEVSQLTTAPSSSRVPPAGSEAGASDMRRSSGGSHVSGGGGPSQRKSSVGGAVVGVGVGDQSGRASAAVTERRGETAKADDGDADRGDKKELGVVGVAGSRRRSSVKDGVQQPQVQTGTIEMSARRASLRDARRSSVTTGERKGSVATDDRRGSAVTAGVDGAEAPPRRGSGGGGVEGGRRSSTTDGGRKGSVAGLGGVEGGGAGGRRRSSTVNYAEAVSLSELDANIATTATTGTKTTIARRSSLREGKISSLFSDT